MKTKFLIILFIGVLFIGLIVSILILSPQSEQTPTTPNPTVEPTPPVDADKSEGAEQAVKEALEIYRGQDPAFFVANNVPFTGANFSIDLQFIPKPEAHYGFIVTATTGTLVTAENEAHEWLLSLGLTEVQIQQLEIVYR